MTVIRRPFPNNIKQKKIVNMICKDEPALKDYISKCKKKKIKMVDFCSTETFKIKNKRELVKDYIKRTCKDWAKRVVAYMEIGESQTMSMLGTTQKQLLKLIAIMARRPRRVIFLHPDRLDNFYDLLFEFKAFYTQLPSKNTPSITLVGESMGLGEIADGYEIWGFKAESN